MAKVIAIITQVDVSGVSHLPNEIFEVEDQARLSVLIVNQCVELYQQPQEQNPKAKKK